MIERKCEREGLVKRHRERKQRNSDIEKKVEESRGT